MRTKANHVRTRELCEQKGGVEGDMLRWWLKIIWGKVKFPASETSVPLPPGQKSVISIQESRLGADRREGVDIRKVSVLGRASTANTPVSCAWRVRDKWL